MGFFSFSSFFTSLVTAAATAVAVMFFSPFSNEIKASVRLIFVPDPLTDVTKNLSAMIKKVEDMTIEDKGYLQGTHRDKWMLKAIKTREELSLVLLSSSESNGGNASHSVPLTDSPSARPQASKSSIGNESNEIRQVEPRQSHLQENDDQPLAFLPGKSNAENANPLERQTNTPSVQKQKGGSSPIQNGPSVIQKIGNPSARHTNTPSANPSVPQTIKTPSAQLQESGTTIQNGANEIQPPVPQQSPLQENDDEHSVPLPSKRIAENANPSARQTNPPPVQQQESGSPIQRCKLHWRANKLISKGEALLVLANLPPMKEESQ